MQRNVRKPAEGTKGTDVSELVAGSKFGRPGVRIVAFLTMFVALLAMTATTSTTTAQAATGYSISSGTWNVRSCPATCEVVGGTISGSIPDLICQTSGP